MTAVINIRLEMPLSTSVTDRALDLPPPYNLIPLREAGDAFAHACSITDDHGAGTLVWVRRYDLVEFAVILEPEEPLAEARRAIYAGANALADALSVHAPPERPVTFDWPDAIRIDGVLVGGCRLGWPDGVPEHAVPPWLVFSGMIRAVALRTAEPGARPFNGALEEVGFETVDAGEIVASFARHLMHWFHEWNEAGFTPLARHWLERLPRKKGQRIRIADNGDLLLFRAADLQPVERRNLRAALSKPSWLDPATGVPWL
ncbi:biotin/lipoate--protein ligase family protein [Chelativorans salis]|uniref:Biotin/lipoate--protein ligase family protein n=1 Tax=Chelativorans salis TaxID=2978478 RepID=A0ABT2LRP3_9HYPH|nr:biotin/lipoate--protein ligase family protein [Chelativorans sp. EGI FJ00035]MCT7377177.1 biotin/lipoate--protein ligase family protein [Chelativorans sp. EGI FJ00035]